MHKCQPPRARVGACLNHPCQVADVGAVGRSRNSLMSDWNQLGTSWQGRAAACFMYPAALSQLKLRGETMMQVPQIAQNLLAGLRAQPHLSLDFCRLAAFER